MTKYVLSVGQCVPDTESLRQLIESNFDAKLVPAALPDDTIQQLQARTFDLILINRKLDADYSDGIEIIQLIKQNPDWSDVPVMLVSNYPEYQQQAVSSGAVPGFGKKEYQAPQTMDKLRRFLA